MCLTGSPRRASTGAGRATRRRSVRSSHFAGDRAGAGAPVLVDDVGASGAELFAGALGRLQMLEARGSPQRSEKTWGRAARGRRRLARAGVCEDTRGPQSRGFRLPTNQRSSLQQQASRPAVVVFGRPPGACYWQTSGTQSRYGVRGAGSSSPCPGMGVIRCSYFRKVVRQIQRATARLRPGR